MKIAPISNEVAILIQEDEEYFFTPVQKKEEKSSERSSERSSVERYQCLDFLYKVKYCFCAFLISLVIGLVFFLVACGHEVCPGGHRNRNKYYPPPK
jgi:hypothetical protein